MESKVRLDPEDLRHRCDPQMLSFDTTESLEGPAGIIGQPRAVAAVEFGLGTSAPGYNIFLSGPAGTGKSTYATSAAGRAAGAKPCPDDWCYIFNFDESDRPLAVRLPPGEAVKFQQDMNEVIEDLNESIPREFEGADFDRQRSALLSDLRERTAAVLEELEREAKKEDLQLRRTSSGFATVPVRDGEPLTQEEFEQLDEETRREIERKGRLVQESVSATVREIRKMEKQARHDARQLERDIGLSVVAPVIDALRQRYSNSSDIVAYLDRAQSDIVDNLNSFRAQGEGDENRPPGPAVDPFIRYRVNVLVSRADDETAPVVMESNPTYQNLVGKVEYKSHMGSLLTDFTMIKAGALHRANGGFLIISIRDLLTKPLAWETLKRALKNRYVDIEDAGEQFRVLPTVTLKPEPIPIKVKVLLVGSPMFYHMLHAYDEDFRKLFKIRADFDVTMNRTPEHLMLYASLISSLCYREGLRHLSRDAVARIIDEGTRIASDQEKLSTRFNEVVELVYEADAWAGADGADVVDSQHVAEAVSARTYRSNRVEERVHEMIARNKIMVDTSGNVVGQINGISVYQLGDYAFGKPTRITARTFLGRAGIINIERKVRMSGRSHSKGVMIMSAYLGSMFARQRPLSLSASLTFEQTYEEIDGDSASSAELYALLSSLAEVPLRQDLAVTGSVNQRGEVQTIGGVNEKIEGFFAICQERGLTGSQGVIIPAGNVDNLMLRDDVVQAVKDGQFSVYAITHVDQGVELLTGITAGSADENGDYPEDTFHGKVARAVAEMADRMARFGPSTRPSQGAENGGDTQGEDEPGDNVE